MNWVIYVWCLKFSCILIYNRFIWCAEGTALVGYKTSWFGCRKVSSEASKVTAGKGIGKLLTLQPVVLSLCRNTWFIVGNYCSKSHSQTDRHRSRHGGVTVVSHWWCQERRPARIACMHKSRRMKRRSVRTCSQEVSLIAQFAITINSNVCPHIRVPSMLMRNPMHDVIGIFNSEARY